MKTTTISLPFFALALLLAACGGEATANVPPAELTPDPILSQAPTFPDLTCGEQWPMTETDGVVTGCTLLEDQVLGGLTCLAYGRVEHHPDGRIKECKSKEAVTYGGVTCKAGGFQRFHPDGSLEECAIGGPLAIAGVQCEYSVSMHPNGMLRRCSTSGQATVAGFDVPSGSYVAFTDEGKPRRLEFEGRQTRTWGKFKCGEVFVRADGSVESCYVEEPMKIGGRELPINGKVCFDPAGKITTEGMGCLEVG